MTDSNQNTTTTTPTTPTVDPLRGLRYGAWTAPEGTNPGLLKGARLSILDTLDNAGGDFRATFKALATDAANLGVAPIGDHYTALALRSLEEEAKVLKYQGTADGKGTPPWQYRLPTAAERAMLAKRHEVMAAVKAALPSASMSVNGVTCDLMTIAAALGIETE